VSHWLQHLPVLPVLVPLFAGAAILLVAESRRSIRALIAVTSALIQLGVAVMLLYLTTDSVPDIWSEGIGVYSIGGWAAPFGIVLVVDRLAALMLVLSATLALPALIYSLARWDRAGVHYHPLFQLLLMGLNGAFLTGDVFNLFVFFEVFLAASYGLLLHGSGSARVKSGLHYIVVNLVASLLFLIGAALIYGVAGTLNMADLSARAPLLAADDRGLFEVGIGILGIAFLVKAGCWPLNFWLPIAYSAAGAPVAAVFSILTKVGVYAVIRMGSLLPDSGIPGPFGGAWLFYAGIITMVFGIVGMMAAQQLARLVAFSIVVSSGTVLAVTALNPAVLIAPALFYLLSSVLATGAFFMLTGMTDRTRTRIATFADEAPLQDVTYGGFGMEDPPDPRAPEEEVGVAIPAAMAFLGLAFVCCVLLVSGLPPLSGFVAKFALLSAALGTATVSEVSVETWVLFATLLATGLAGVIALTRIGMRLFWSSTGRTTPRLRIIEAGPVAFLVLLCIALTVSAAPVMVFLESTAEALRTPHTYVRAVLSEPTFQAPTEELTR
jgi:multicomponent K+:H+ antiporter subunit D